MSISVPELPGIEYESVDLSGITFPPDDQWQIGLTWTSVYTITGQMTLEGVGRVTSHIYATIENEITAQEEISVPAGNYADAMRVDSYGTLVVESRVGEIALPPTETTFGHTNWFVKDVGMVKSASNEPDITYTSELVSVD
jgi:hypothetical protein